MGNTTGRWPRVRQLVASRVRASSRTSSRPLRWRWIELKPRRSAVGALSGTRRCNGAPSAPRAVRSACVHALVQGRMCSVQERMTWVILGVFCPLTLNCKFVTTGSHDVRSSPSKEEQRGGKHRSSTLALTPAHPLSALGMPGDCM